MLRKLSLSNPFISKDELEKLFEIQNTFIDSYKEDVLNKGLDNKKWLLNTISKYLDDKTEQEIELITSEIINTIDENDNNLNSLQEAKTKGISKNEWFAHKLTSFINSDILKGASETILKNQLVNYFNKIDNSILESNTLLFEAVKTKDNNINLNPNLDGIIAEYFHATTFNIDSAIKDKDFKAIVKESNNLNSVDISVIDNNKIVQNYQLKYGKDSSSTNEYFKQGNYRGQRKLVPAEQVNDIDKANSKIAYKGVESKELTKKEAKEIQKNVQNGNIEAIITDYNSLEIKNLAIGISKKAAFSGMLTFTTTIGYRLVDSYSNNKKIEHKEIIKESLENGLDTFVKQALAGTLKVASEKGYIKILPKQIPTNYIANIAYFGVESFKTFYKFSKGKISFTEALENLGSIGCAIALSEVCSSIGATIGTTIGGILTTPLGLTPVGNLVGGIAGSVVGAMVGFSIGTETGKKVVNSVKKISNYAYEATKSLVEKGLDVVKNVANKVYETASNITSSISNSISNAISSVASWLF